MTDKKSKELNIADFPELQKFMTTEEVAKDTGISEYNLGQLRHRKQGFRYLKIGHAVFYLKKDIQAWKVKQAELLKEEVARLEE